MKNHPHNPRNGLQIFLKNIVKDLLGVWLHDSNVANKSRKYDFGGGRKHDGIFIHPHGRIFHFFIPMYSNFILREE